MKLGISTYSLFGAIRSGEMSVLDVIDWIADQGGEHVEIVPIGYNLHESPDLIEKIRAKAADRGLDISNYAVGGNFAVGDDAAVEAEIKRLMGEVDIARALGVKRMRHDVASGSDVSTARFQRELPKLAEACRRVAEYAAGFGIVTSLENHGYFMQGSERVLALIDAVGSPNFKLTLDVGNFMCADENSVAAVKRAIGQASIVHLKDFYLRPSYRQPGEGWFPTTAGNYLRGAIFGHGDIDTPEVMRVVKASGFDGYLSLEFEGMEDCRVGARIGLANAKRLWAEA
ncbi:sugar phosphate isomerase/epimerase family protein [Cohnella zeiphila]|uniref:Sugar phosphate isomerase/epimerase n=1 Tax=Cohnella zeiphila TaxID=2761120 RepID=A0A7X0SHE3_9BACL|nr:sugar phosphate isomerase/epimerase family protein [Cohnella zeiphila]MBB6730003.1 sugar phosphate isomerase/epimerase [Cohnella zeiphila]